MVENFGGSILYLILFIIQLLGLTFYCYLTILNPKKIINDYQVGEGAIAPIRLIGSFILPLVLIGIYLMFTSIENMWVYFVLGLITTVYQLLYDLGNRMGIIDKNYTFLATVGSTAPFIGLFGTVWGIMNSFQSIAIAQNTNLAVVAPGIAEALFATALGLFVAIPAVVAYNKISSDLSKYFISLETFIDEFTTIFFRQLENK